MSNNNNNNTFQSVNSGTTSSSSVSKDDIIRGLNEDLARDTKQLSNMLYLVPL